jgi:hypothetical protein
LLIKTITTGSRVYCQHTIAFSFKQASWGCAQLVATPKIDQDTAKTLKSMSVTIDIVGIAIGDRGRSCKAHHVCGTQVDEGTLVRLRLKTILVEGLEEDVIAVNMARFGEDRKEKRDGCRVGFTPRQQYDGALFKVTEVYSRLDESSIKRKKVHHNHGFATAVLVEKPEKKTENTKKRKLDKLDTIKKEEEEIKISNRKMD